MEPKVRTYAEALDLWTNMIELRENDETDNPGVGIPQNCFSLLREWWTNTAYDSVLTCSVREWIIQAARCELDLAIEPRIPGSGYNLALFRLWVYEQRLYLRSPYAKQSDISLRDLRQKAAVEAACHRVQSATMSAVLKVGVASQFEGTNIQISLKASDGPCSWLSKKDKYSALPYYCWDRQQRRTVLTSDIGNHPAYVAISHTWGRWRVATNYSILNVPWLVPGNSRFQVTRLPELLANLGLPERYIWLDLLCIPQTDPENDDRAKIEIANQASIFSLASRAIAWLATVPSWEHFQSSLEYMALQSIEQESDIDVSEALSKARKNANGTTYIAQLTSDASTGYLVNSDECILQPWFTSLWTLQELCLRSDMLLYDNDWRPLKIGELCIPFDHIIALCFSESRAKYLKRHRLESVHPQGAQEINIAMVKTGLKDLLSLTAMGVLILGDQRYCEDRRAEAIMSVVGCKDWFINSPSQQPSREDLILGRYPLAFVQEVRQKLKGQFFASVDERRYVGAPIRGTLLPFSAANSNPPKARTMLPEIDSNMIDHVSVANWHIQRGGQVLLRDACMVDAQRDRKLFVHIMWPYPEHVIWAEHEAETCAFRREQDGTVDLNHFLTSFWPQRKKYAVHLNHCGDFITGFIIAEVSKIREQEGSVTIPERVFAKVYSFWYIGPTSDLPSTERVNWVVL